MKVRYLILGLLTISSIHATHDPIDDLALNCTPSLEHNTRDFRMQSLIQSFVTIVKVFIKLITNEEVVTRVRVIEELITSLIQTALQITYYASSSATPQQTAQQLIADDPIKNALVRAITQNSHTIRFEAAVRAPQHQKPDETTQKVITHFSSIVQSFFNIVQDPENSENVTPNLVNMLANIVTIGQEVIKRSSLSYETARQDIMLFVMSGVDTRFKNDLLTAFYLTVHRNHVAMEQNT